MVKHSSFGVLEAISLRNVAVLKRRCVRLGKQSRILSKFVGAPRMWRCVTETIVKCDCKGMPINDDISEESYQILKDVNEGREVRRMSVTHVVLLMNKCMDRASGSNLSKSTQNELDCDWNPLRVWNPFQGFLGEQNMCPPAMYIYTSLEEKRVGCGAVRSPREKAWALTNC